MLRVLEGVHNTWESGELALFKMAEWVRHCTVEHLGIGQGHLLSRATIQDSEEGSVTEWEHEDSWTSLLSTLPFLLAHNSIESKILFAQAIQSCPICYDELPGTQFDRFNCGHYSCNSCTRQICVVNVKENNIDLIKCSESGCTQVIDQTVVAKYVDKAEYEQYKQTMKKRSGYIECRKCEQWAKIEPVSRSCYCEHCYHASCLLCLQRWHPGVPCGYVPPPKDNGKRVGRRELHQTKPTNNPTMLTNVDFQNMRPCPGCSMMINKFEGCNKVRCTACSQYFCWVCLKIVQNYDHFRGGCELFGIVTSTNIAVKKMQDGMLKEAKKIRDEDLKKRGVNVILPDTITHLMLDTGFNQVLGPESLPRHLTHLTFGSMFNQVIKHNDLPPTIIAIVFGHKFNQPIAPGSLPESITHITFGTQFNQSIGSHNLPRNLQYLKLPPYFKQAIEQLPESLTYLSGAYCQHLPFPLPSGLEHLAISDIPPAEFLEHLTALSSVTFNILANPAGIAVLPSSVTRIDIELQTAHKPMIQGSFPPRLTHLSLGHGFDSPILQGQLPHSLTHLSLGDRFNQPILPGQLPPRLTHLAFGRIYSHPLVAGSIPRSVTHFTCGDLFRQTLTRDLIPSVTNITVSSRFETLHITSDRLSAYMDGLTDLVHNLVLIKALTGDLKSLYLENINHELHRDNLPDTITKLRFHHAFNQKMGPGSLPRHLTHLIFGESFNQVIKPNVLPPTLISLQFGNQFNQPIDPGTLPNSLEYLIFGNRFHQSIGPHNLPKSLTHLRLGEFFDYPLEPGTLPDSITHIWFNSCIMLHTGSLPNNLTHLNGIYWQNLPTPLPSSLEHMAIFDNLPSRSSSGLEALSSVTFNYLADPFFLSYLPPTVTKLVISNQLNRPIIPGSLPPNLTHLSLGYGYNQSILRGQLPSSLTHLTFGELFNQPILPCQLPQSLTHLAVGRVYSEPLVIGSIPSSVTHFTCGDLFRQTLTRGLIPSVTNVTVSMHPGLSSFHFTGELVSAYLDSLSDLVTPLLQIKGITVHCQDHSNDSYVDLRMIDRRSILVSNPFFVAMCPLSKVRAAIGHHTSLQEREKTQYISPPVRWNTWSKLRLYGSLLISAVLATFIAFRRR
eukprot:gene12370-14511_t